MDLRDIIELIDYCDKTSLTSFEIIENNDKISFMKHQNVLVMPPNTLDQSLGGRKLDLELEIHKSDGLSIKQNVFQMRNGNMNLDEKLCNLEEDIKVIRSPYVGMVSLPDHIKLDIKDVRINKGDVICTIEAMKIYNDIVSPFDGEIIEILVEESNLVEFDQPIMKIRVDVNDQTIQKDIDSKPW